MPLGGPSASRDPITSPCELLLSPESLENCGPILPQAAKKNTQVLEQGFSGDIRCKRNHPLSLENSEKVSSHLNINIMS